MAAQEERDGVGLTNLDQELFTGADATKRDLIDYLEAGRDRILPGLRDRPLSVIRVRPGQQPFMQKNVPKYTPEWVETTTVWAESSHRDVSYALCNDWRTLLWFGNQRAVEYHPTLNTMSEPDRQTYLIMDLDPPEGSGFDVVIKTAKVVKQALDELDLAAVIKTSGSKGVHIMVPLDGSAPIEDVAAATRAVAARAEKLDPDLATTAYIKEDRGGKVFLDSTRAGGATIVAAYSPRVRPGTTVSFPVPWDDLDDVKPADFTVKSALKITGDPWADLMPADQTLPADLIAEGHEIPVARVQAMHEGKRRKRAREAKGES
ncbi:non-homologous end-joining DNA ligase [Microlunatus parietis]|uniref:DNA ligase D n=1 Tax=Microlunatus parietis TaxID=682979 RepID=A0A7Y9IAQ8_9ACTN|nr:non-homologous end-joining DNA ligase [Microlunatus parietis]NYE73362.1 DNA ligase D [Microlunatus parietis]